MRQTPAEHPFFLCLKRKQLVISLQPASKSEKGLTFSATLAILKFKDRYRYPTHDEEKKEKQLT